jgi:predicted metal-binding protein
MMVLQVVPVIDAKMRSLCKKPYPNHPKGCPNFGSKEGCPPDAKMFGQVFDLAQPVCAVVNRFDLGAHRERMRAKHPNWSQRQLDCCLYWQNTARNQLELRVDAFLLDHPGYTATYCPEAMGVNVTATLAAVGVRLEWPPDKWAHHVALVGVLQHGTQEALRQGQLF